jgi:hypothetical protein
VLKASSYYLDDLLCQGVDLLRAVQGVEFWQPPPSALLAFDSRSHTDIPALKVLEEWFDSWTRRKKFGRN